jgi:hypothetical protein
MKHAPSLSKGHNRGRLQKDLDFEKVRSRLLKEELARTRATMADAVFAQCFSDSRSLHPSSFPQ